MTFCRDERKCFYTEWNFLLFFSFWNKHPTEILIKSECSYTNLPDEIHENRITYQTE